MKVQNNNGWGLLAARLLCAGLVSAASPGIAFGQQVQAGPTTELVTAFIRGVDTAYNPATGGYFIVGGAGPLYGICVNSAGAATSGLITVNADGYGAFPRAQYSPHIGSGGGFLVTWPEEVGNPTELHARTVTCSGQLGPETVISGGYNAWLESGAALAYSPTSQRFLVAWKSVAPVRLKVALVDNTGTLASGVVDISTGFGRDPGVAWNPVRNEFGVSFSGESGDPAKPLNYSAFVIVPAGVPTLFTRTTFNTFYGGMNSITDLTFNPATGRFVMAWVEYSSGKYTKIAEFDAAAGLLTSGLASARLGSYDSMSLAYNPVSGTFLLAGNDSLTDGVVGLELNSRGFPFNGENTLSSSHAPSFYNRIASSPSSRTWNVAFSSRRYQGLGSFIATGFASGGGPGGSYDAPPTAPPPSGSTSSCTTVQPGSDWVCVNGNWLPPGSTGGGSTSTGGCSTPSPGAGWTCVNGNWLPPSGGSTSTGGCTTVQPGPNWVCVNGGWLPGDSSSTGGTSTGGCTTVQPGSNWVCVNGNWVQSTSTSTSSCTTVQPGPNWVCVNGNWLPGDSSTSTSSGGSLTGGCTSVQPGSNWVCVNGNWIPSTSTSSCTTVQPGSNWVCVNGNWIPSTSTSSCTTVQPGSNWVCVNGNWIPSTSTSSCTTVQPGSNWVCVDGNWIPSTSTSSCTSVQPGSNWVCVNGSWVPPDSYLAPTSACTTVRPGQYWTCDAATGNWLPPQ